MLQDLATNLGLPLDQLKAMISLLVSLPLSHCFHYIKNPVHRHIFSLSIGVVLQFFLYDHLAWSLIIFVLGTYLFLRINRPKTGWVVMIGAMVTLSTFHIHRMLTDYGNSSLYITTSIMVLVPKLTMFAWDYSDGAANLDRKLTPEQEKSKLKELPSLLAFSSYCFNFSSSILGPVHPFYVYNEFIQIQGVYKNIPSCAKRVATLLAKTVFFTVLGITLDSKFNVTSLLTKEFAEKNILEQQFYMIFIAMLLRFRFYAGWTIAQANVTLAGLPYDGNDENGQPKWERMITVHTSHELKTTVKERVATWNTAISLWLRNYVYVRIATKENQSKNPKAGFIANIGTFIISAFWHGCYPAYYFSFILWGLCVEVSRIAYRNRKLFSFADNIVFLPVKTFLVLAILGYPQIIFDLLTTDRVIHFFKVTKCSVPIGMLIVLALNFLQVKSKSKKSAGDGETKKNGEVTSSPSSKSNSPKKNN